MSNTNQLLETGRHLLRDYPGLTEAEFRNRMLERFRAEDSGLKSDTANMQGGEGSGVLAVFLLPWIVFRWLGWRGRLARHRSDMDVVVRMLRLEGHFTAAPESATGSPAAKDLR